MAYHKDPMISGIYSWANSADSDQTAPRSSLNRVVTICNSVCIFLKHYPMVKPVCSNFRLISSNI